MRGLPNALFFVAAAGTQTLTVAMSTWCTNALTASATPTPSYIVTCHADFINKYQQCPCDLAIVPENHEFHTETLYLYTEVSLALCVLSSSGC